MEMAHYDPVPNEAAKINTFRSNYEALSIETSLAHRWSQAEEDDLRGCLLDMENQFHGWEQFIPHPDVPLVSFTQNHQPSYVIEQDGYRRLLDVSHEHKDVCQENLSQSKLEYSQNVDACLATAVNPTPAKKKKKRSRFASDNIDQNDFVEAFGGVTAKKPRIKAVSADEKNGKDEITDPLDRKIKEELLNIRGRNADNDRAERKQIYYLQHLFARGPPLLEFVVDLLADRNWTNMIRWTETPWQFRILQPKSFYQLWTEVTPGCEMSVRNFWWAFRNFQREQYCGFSLLRGMGVVKRKIFGFFGCLNPPDFDQVTATMEEGTTSLCATTFHSSQARLSHWPQGSGFGHGNHSPVQVAPFFRTLNGVKLEDASSISIFYSPDHSDSACSSTAEFDWSKASSPVSGVCSHFSVPPTPTSLDDGCPDLNDSRYSINEAPDLPFFAAMVNNEMKGENRPLSGSVNFGKAELLSGIPSTPF